MGLNSSWVVIKAIDSFDGAVVLACEDPRRRLALLTLEIEVVIDGRVLAHWLVEFILKFVLPMDVASLHTKVSDRLVPVLVGASHVLRVLGDTHAHWILLDGRRWSWRQGVPLGLQSHISHLNLISI